MPKSPWPESNPEVAPRPFQRFRVPLDILRRWSLIPRACPMFVGRFDGSPELNRVPSDVLDERAVDLQGKSTGRVFQIGERRQAGPKKSSESESTSSRGRAQLADQAKRARNSCWRWVGGSRVISKNTTSPGRNSILRPALPLDVRVTAASSVSDEPDRLMQHVCPKGGASAGQVCRRTATRLSMDPSDRSKASGL